MPLIDVRTPEEYQEAHIKGAINLPLSDLQENSSYAQEVLEKIKSKAQSIDAQLDVPLRVHCASGGRSAVACGILHKMGFTNVRNLGGFNDACKCVEETQ